MIYTITFNPSLDYIVEMETLRLGFVNRTETEMILPGGKGLNVSMVLKNLGFESTALGFLAGFTGKEIRRKMEERGCITEFIEIEKGWSRINMKLKAGEESEINGQGPFINEESMNRLYDKLEKLAERDVLVLAGGIPSSMPDTVYSEIMRRLRMRNISIVVDATKELLLNVLQYQPFLIKPNHYELGEMFGVTLKGKDEVITYARKLKERGAVNVLISMAGDGAVLIDEYGVVHQSEAPKGTVMNSVGAGDSMVAGFLAGYLESGDYGKAFYKGIAAGSASAFSKNLATESEVVEILSSMNHRLKE